METQIESTPFSLSFYNTDVDHDNIAESFCVGKERGDLITNTICDAADNWAKDVLSRIQDEKILEVNTAKLSNALILSLKSVSPFTEQEYAFGMFVVGANYAFKSRMFDAISKKLNQSKDA